MVQLIIQRGCTVHEDDVAKLPWIRRVLGDRAVTSVNLGDKGIEECFSQSEAEHFEKPFGHSCWRASAPPPPE
jgi:hypothetical protein